MIESGHSVLVLGEFGSGVEALSEAIRDRYEGEFSCASERYKGSTKQFFKSLAEQLEIPTENEDGKPLNVDQLKEEILLNASESWLFIFPESKRLPASVRYWLEDAIAAEVRMVCFSPSNPGRDIFLQMLEVELELPDDSHIRDVMKSEAQRLGLDLSDSELAELQPLAGKNPTIARKVIQRRKLGITQTVEHKQYIVIMPIILAALFSFAVVRFIGLGTNNKGLYIVGGISLTVAMGLKQLGRVQGARKRLGE